MSDSSSSWIDSFLQGIPDFRGGINTFMKGESEKISGQTTETAGKLTVAEGEADTSIYTQYLKDFPQYESFKENQYQTQENQTLADRLANMGMRGQTSGGGATTSAAAGYAGEKSLWDQGYTALQNQLGLQQTEAQQKLNVAGATVAAGNEEIKAGQTEQTIGAVTEAIGATMTGAAIGSMIAPGIGTLIGGTIGLGIDLIKDLGQALKWW